MSGFLNGKLEMLTLTAYKDPEFTKKDEEFKALINPEGLKESYQIVLNESKETNSANPEQKFVKIKSGEMTIKFLFDSTGIFNDVKSAKGLKNSLVSSVESFSPVPVAEDKGVSEEVGKLKKLFLDYNKDKHETRYCRLEWGAEKFNCRFSKVEIEHQLYNNSGYPIRSLVTAICRSTDVSLKPMQSPDLTHVRTVKAGDTLQLLTDDIYGSPKYYLYVAKVNRLLNFRKLEVGMKLFFPPIEK